MNFKNCLQFVHFLSGIKYLLWRQLLVFRFIVFSLCFYSGGMLHAQVIFTDTGELTPREELLDMYEKALIIQHKNIASGFNKHPMYILEIDDTKYLLPDGLFDVYIWHDSTWINLYKNFYGGYNYHSKKFVWNNTIYSFGGSGYWNEHGQLIFFNFKLGEWELAPVEKFRDWGISYVDIVNNELRVMSIEDHYAISLKNWTIRNISTPDRYGKKARSGINNRPAYETDDYFFIRSKVMVDKRNHEIFHGNDSDMEVVHMFKNAVLIHIRGNNITYFNSSDFKEINLDEARLLAVYTIKENVQTGKTKGRMWFISFLFAAFIAAFWYYKKKQQAKKAREQYSELPVNPIVQKIESFDENILTTEQLDSILEIDYIQTSETLRYKRSILIKQINDSYKNNSGHALIERIKDPIDGRRYLYEIKR
jgi:hypothetical protein